MGELSSSFYNKMASNISKENLANYKKVYTITICTKNKMTIAFLILKYISLIPI